MPEWKVSHDVKSWKRKADPVFGDLNGSRNVRYLERACAVVGGRFSAVSFYDLTFAQWDGTKWVLASDKAQWEPLYKPARVDGLATDGTRAWAVTVLGAVFEWNAGVWTLLGGDGDALFEKERRFARYAWDAKRARLVRWGGNNGTRASSDTLIFEKGAWRKSKARSLTKDPEKRDNYWLFFDAARQAVVLLASEGVFMLDDEKWVALDVAPPAFVATATRSYVQAVPMPGAKGTSVLDPLTGTVHPEATALPLAQGLEPANDSGWFWAFDPGARRLFGANLDAVGLTVNSLDLE